LVGGRKSDFAPWTGTKGDGARELLEQMGLPWSENMGQGLHERVTTDRRRIVTAIRMEPFSLRKKAASPNRDRFFGTRKGK